MDPEKRAAVISLFEEMGKKEQQAAPDSKRDVQIGDTTIIGSTIVLCTSDQALKDVLSTLMGKMAPPAK